MTFADQLRDMDACGDAIEWVGTRTLEQAWNECERGDWMAWLTRKLGLNTSTAVADMAERVWHLVEPESQLACAWAIDCARRGADADEMAAAGAAAEAAAEAAASDAADAARAAAWTARAAAWAAWAAASAAAWAAASDAADAARAAAWTAGVGAWDAAEAAELRAQADIMREHFSAAQISAALAARKRK